MGKVDAMNEEEHPLVSFCIPTYNQATFVAAALESAFAQTYTPLEIIICDDKSPDDTVSVIKEKIAEYKERGGENKVIFEENECNLGVLGNYGRCFSLAQGDFIVTGSGDDISLPNRVERLVRTWNENGRKASVMIHDVIEIDADGHQLKKRDYQQGLLGAAMAYVADVSRKFGVMQYPKGFEDVVFQERALLLGDRLHVPEALMYYRVGCSTSSFRRNFRSNMANNAQMLVYSRAQFLTDLEYYNEKHRLTNFELLKEDAIQKLDRANKTLKLWTSARFAERLQGFRAAAPRWFTKAWIVDAVLLLPTPFQTFSWKV